MQKGSQLIQSLASYRILSVPSLLFLFIGTVAFSRNGYRNLSDLAHYLFTLGIRNRAMFRGAIGIRSTA